MAKSKLTPLVQYTHEDKERLNNPPVGLVTPETDKDENKKKYEYDPHLDPQLQWDGKVERTSFEVPTVSLHVHERIDPKTIISAIRNGKKDEQPSLFEVEHAPLREDIEFYFKLPNWFTIETPIGRDNPDWALIFRNEKKIYLVTETKFTLDEHQRRQDENLKIKCDKAHFNEFEDVEYKVVKSAGELV